MARTLRDMPANVDQENLWRYFMAETVEPDWYIGLFGDQVSGSGGIHQEPQVFSDVTPFAETGYQRRIIDSSQVTFGRQDNNFSPGISLPTLQWTVINTIWNVKPHSLFLTPDEQVVPFESARIILFAPLRPPRITANFRFPALLGDRLFLNWGMITRYRTMT